MLYIYTSLEVSLSETASCNCQHSLHVSLTESLTYKKHIMTVTCFLFYKFHCFDHYFSRHTFLLRTLEIWFRRTCTRFLLNSLMNLRADIYIFFVTETVLFLCLLQDLSDSCWTPSYSLLIPVLWIRGVWIQALIPSWWAVLLYGGTP